MLPGPYDDTIAHLRVLRDRLEHSCIPGPEFEALDTAILLVETLRDYQIGVAEEA